MDTSTRRAPHLPPSDLLAAARRCRDTCASGLAADWDVSAGALTWTCRRTLDHILNTLCLYATYVASRTRERLPIARDGTPTLPVAELLRLVEPMAAVLAEVARSAAPGTRVYHPAGLADVEGYVAMGCDEILIHTADIARGLGVPFRPPDALSRRVLGRLFPWAPTKGDPWAALLWANGRAALADRPQLEADWYWWCAPLAEWDGTITKRAAPPAWV